MAFDWSSTAGAVAGGAVGGITSALGIGNKQQRKQNRLMNEDAMAINDRYSQKAEARAYARQKEMYERSYKDESPVAKRKQLEDAGLSVGLMYGGSGGMGGAGQIASQPVGNTGTASGSGATRGGGAETMQGMMMGISLARQKAEIANIQADTKLKETDVTKKGAEATNIETDTGLKFEYIKNAKLQGEALQWSNKQQKITTEIMDATSMDAIQKSQAELYTMQWEVNRLLIEVDNAGIDNEIKQKTKNDVINQTKNMLNYQNAQIYKMATEAERNVMDTMLGPIKALLDQGNLELRGKELEELINNNNRKITQGYVNESVKSFVSLMGHAAQLLTKLK